MVDKIIITIELRGAAFDQDNGGTSDETVRILRKLADSIEHGGIASESLRDINGNRCGTVVLE